MLIVVLVEEPAGLGIVWRIDVDAVHTPPIPLQQQAKGLEVFTANQQPVGYLVQAFKAGEQAVNKVLLEVLSVNDKGRMSLQERDALILLALASGEQVGLFFIDVEQLLPLDPLRIAYG